MFPVLVHIGWFSLPTYGLLMATGFLLALMLGQSLARKEGLDPEKLTNLWVWLLLGGIVGAKLALYVVEWRRYVENPRALLGTWRSAGVYYGGFLLAAVAGLYYARRARLPLGLTADLVAPTVALGQSVGRVGCLAAGCCYGRPTDVAWAITFTNPAAHQITSVPLGVPLHPSQVYLSLNALALCGVLLLLWRWRRRTGGPAGIVFWSYVGLYSLTRFWLESYRGDERGSVGPLSTSQALGIVGMLAAAVAIVVLLRRRRDAA